MKSNMVMMTKIVRKGEKIYPTKGPIPVAVAEDNFDTGDIGIIDKSVTYPVFFHDTLLLLPGLKKNSPKKEKRCPNCKKIE